MKNYNRCSNLLLLKCLIAFIIPSCLLLAQDGTENSQSYRREFDLDKDGNPEYVEIVPRKIRVFNEGENNTYTEIPFQKNYTNNEAFFETLYQLRVIKGDGNAQKVIWQDDDNEFSFVSSELGIEYINCVGDIDGDGTVELVSNAAQSDISPAFIRILTWKNNKFNWDDSTYYFGTVLSENEPYTIDKEFKPCSHNLMDEYFEKISKNPNLKEKNFVWIMNFLEVKSPGTVIADIYSSNGYYGKAEMKRDGKSFMIVNWVEAMKKIE